MQQGRMGEAVRELTKAERRNPYFAKTHSALGIVYHHRKQPEKAEHHYQRALELNPELSEAWNNYGALLLDIGRYQDAVECFQKVLEDIMYPTPQFAQGHLGYAYYRLGRYKDATRHLKNAIATDPKFCRGYLWLADVYASKERRDDVIHILQRFMRRCVEKPEVREYVNEAFISQARYDLGSALLDAGKKSLAKKYFERCVEESDTLSAIYQSCREGLEAAGR
jgi:type IV pilus biogenesis/stability protein PilW